MYIFISHSSNDAEMALDVCNCIEEKGNRCFLAPRDIRAGYEYAAEIAEGVDRSEVLLLILSEAANQSPHVLREVERAVTKSIPILVYKIEEVTLTKSMEYFLMTHQWMNAKKNNYDDILENIEKLKTALEQSGNVALQKMVQSSDKTVLKKPRNKNKFLVALAAVVVILLLVAGVVMVTIGKGVGSGENGNTQGNSTVQDNIVEDIQLGDTVILGNYNDADISWRVLHISEDRTEAVLVASNVLTVKAYDAPESGKYNYDGDVSYYGAETEAETDIELQAFVRGDSSWENSVIRTWLNSADENVEYIGQAPVSSAMADRSNGYNAEPGFLCAFTEEELSAIKETTLETKGNALCETDLVETRDKVFLLSMDELKWFEEANVSLLAEPTEQAVEQDETYWYRDYCLGFGTQYHMWWLREPVEGSSSQCYLVGNGYQEENIYTWETGVESFGIRPAVTVDLTKDCIRMEMP